LFFHTPYKDKGVVNAVCMGLVKRISYKKFLLSYSEHKEKADPFNLVTEELLFLLMFVFKIGWILPNFF